MKELRIRVSLFILNITLVCLILLFVFGLITAVKPYNILEHEILPYEVVEDEVIAGDVFHLRVKFCKNGNYDSIINSQLVDGFVIFYPTLTASLPEGCYDFLSEKKVPANTPTGDYKYTETITYETHNPFKPEVTYTNESETFRIVNPELDGI